jgi:quercetin dioxygenase-like cupin family protein
MSKPGYWIRKFLAGSISRREFVERAAYGGLGVTATTAALSYRSQARAQEARSAGAADGVLPPAAAYSNPDQTNHGAYSDWLKAENIPVLSGYAVTNLRTADVKPWARLGAVGAHIRLLGGGGVADAYLCEIPGGGITTPQRYLFEEVIYVLSGTGETAIWTPGTEKLTVQWQSGSMFSPPLNAWRQHFNRDSGAARLVAITNAPVVIDLFHNLDFVFNNDFAFRDRYDGGFNDFRAGQDKIHDKTVTSTQGGQSKAVHSWLGAFVPDARTIALSEAKRGGVDNSRIELEMADNTMQAHVSQFAVGSYMPAHRHGPGVHILVLNGQGYTLMWNGSLKYSQADQKVRIDFNEASLFVPPDRWWHQHFNTGPAPVRYLAAGWAGEGRWSMEALGGGHRAYRLSQTSTRQGGSMIDYQDEDPAIRDMYAAELTGSGIAINMPAAK